MLLWQMSLTRLEYLDILMLNYYSKEDGVLMKTRVNYEKEAELLKALAHPVRLQIVHNLLIAGCRNVRCMEAHIGMSQSSISQHLQRLRAAGVVVAERSGNEVYYRAASRQVAVLVAALMEEEEAGYVV